jgi:uncharacterized protein YegL
MAEPTAITRELREKIYSEELDATVSTDEVLKNLRRRVLSVFFVIDVSNSMRGAGIGSVNSAMRDLIPAIRKKNETNAAAEFQIAIMLFSSRAEWKHGPRLIEDYVYEEINETYPATNYSYAVSELNDRLSPGKYLSSSSGRYIPVVVFLSDGKPSDPALYEEALIDAQNNPWFRHAQKMGIVVSDASKPNDFQESRQAVRKFTGDEAKVYEARDATAIARQIQLVSSRIINENGKLTGGIKIKRPEMGEPAQVLEFTDEEMRVLYDDSPSYWEKHVIEGL